MCCLYWEPQNVKINNSNNFKFSIGLKEQPSNFVVSSEFSCMSKILNLGIPVSDICPKEMTAKLILLSSQTQTPFEECLSNVSASECSFEISPIPGQSENKKLKGFTTFVLRVQSGLEIPPGTHPTRLKISTRGDNLTPFTRLLSQPFEITVPYRTFITPETITQVGAFKLQFEPHPQANFTKVEFYEDTNPNNDDNDQLLGSSASPPFEINVNFTANGTRTFYAKAFEVTLSQPIMSDKRKIVVNIP